MSDEPPNGEPRSLRPHNSYVIVKTDDVIVWRDSHRGVVEHTKAGKRWVATFWVDEEDGFPQLASSQYPADDPELEAHWAEVIAEGSARLEAGLKRLREG